MIYVQKCTEYVNRDADFHQFCTKDYVSLRVSSHYELNTIFGVVLSLLRTFLAGLTAGVVDCASLFSAFFSGVFFGEEFSPLADSENVDVSFDFSNKTCK